MKKVTVSVVGGSGYVGGELLRILLKHPYVTVHQVTSERFAGQYVKLVHPNLRQFSLQFVSLKELKTVDILFICLPHGQSIKMINILKKKAKLIIDLSADFRLNNPNEYEKWYGFIHPNGKLLKQKILGLPEIYKEKIMKASFIACPGCLATATILSLYPLLKANIIEDAPIVIEAKTGSSGSGNEVTLASHHAERSGAIRTFKPTGHRHTAEIIQELTINNKKPKIFFSATAVEAVRGILITSQMMLKKGVEEKDIWQLYRSFSQDKPFIRIVKEKKGIYRYPEPKILIGTNICEIGFEKEIDSQRLVVMSAIDNLVKGAAGQAVQCLNINRGWEETVGLETVGLHPI